MKRNSSALENECTVLLKKKMTKKAYGEFCRSKRCNMMVGRNYGTRTMDSRRDKARSQRKKDWKDTYEE